MPSLYHIDMQIKEIKAMLEKVLADRDQPLLQAKPLIDPNNSKLLDTLVSRFLSWPLPESVCSDLCVIRRESEGQRSGTNMLTAIEARQMLLHVLGVDTK